MLETLTTDRADTVRAAVKRVALDQLKAGGPGAVAINAIARELGVSGPALYRYFKNRDALLTALAKDAYDDLADTLAQAGSFTRAYREWALAQPHRYRLLFSAPLPGYDAHQPELVAAAQRSMDLLLPLVDDDLTRAVTLWSRAHGHVSLEIEGNFASMGLDPEALYEAALATAQPATPRGGHCGRRAGRRTSTTATWRTLSQVTWVNAARMPSNATGPTALPGTRRRFAGPPPSGTNRAREPAIKATPVAAAAKAPSARVSRVRGPLGGHAERPEALPATSVPSACTREVALDRRAARPAPCPGRGRARARTGQAARGPP